MKKIILKIFIILLFLFNIKVSINRSNDRWQVQTSLGYKCTAQTNYEDEIVVTGCAAAQYKAQLLEVSQALLSCYYESENAYRFQEVMLEDVGISEYCRDYLWQNEIFLMPGGVYCPVLEHLIGNCFPPDDRLFYLPLRIEAACPYKQEATGDGSSGGGSTGDSNGNGGTDPDQVEVCDCCGKNPCVCNVCPICGGVTNESGNDCTLCSCECPDVTEYTIVDSKSVNRRVTGINKTLYMVSDGNERNAQFILNTDFNNWQPGFPQWIGSYLKGSNGGNYIIYSGNTSSNIVVDCGFNCPKFEGRIEIVPESKMSLSYKIDEVKDKLDALGNAVNTGMKALGEVTSTQTVWQATLSGQAMEKNVDKYADGTQIGKYYSLSLNGSVSCALPELKIYVCNYGLAKIYGFLNLGTAVCGLTLEAVKDPSQANEYSCSGNLALSFNNPGLGVKGIVGVEDKICTIITAQATLTKFEISNGFTIEADGIYNTPKITYSNVVGEIEVKGKFFTNFDCALYKEDVVLFDGASNLLEKKLLYPFN